MGPSYIEFNKWCFDYYLNHNKDIGYGSFFIPPSDIDDFLKRGVNNQASLIFRELQDDWYYLTNNDPKNNIPKCFGLVALQCYAAYLMENDESATEYKYNSRLSTLLEITNLHDGSKYGSGSISTQDEIWKRAKHFLEKQQIVIDIPKERERKDRYIQYPLSQVIFNKEDLKKFETFLREFDHELKSDIRWFEIQFIKYLTQNERNKLHTRVQKNILGKYDVDPTKRNRDYKLLVKQLYNYFLSKEWQNELKKETHQRSFKRTKVSEEVRFAFGVYYDLEDDTLEFYPTENDSTEESQLGDFIKLLNDKSVFLFEKTSINTQFEYTTYVTLNHEYIVICHPENPLKNSLEEKFEITFKKIENSDFSFSHCLFTDERIFNLFHQKTESIIVSPISVYGKRIDFRRRTYLKGFDLKVYINVDFLHVFELRRISDGVTKKMNHAKGEILLSLQAGSYEISIGSNFTPYRFDIVEIEPLIHFLKHNHDKLDLTTLQYTTTNDGVHGILFPTTQVKNISITDIRDILVNKKKVESENTIIKALNRYKYGRN